MAEGRERSDQRVRREYDRLAADYDRRWRRYIDATMDAVLDAVEAQRAVEAQGAVELRGNECVLDIPCGTGELERRLLARWPRLRVVAADLSSGMLEQASSKKLGGTATWLKADVSRLPFADARFDWIFCVNSFHCFPTPQQSLDEMHRVLRPGGRLVLVDWCDDYLTCKLCSAWLRLTDPAFYHTYSLGACRRATAQSGFELLSADRFRVSWLWGLMRIVCRRPDPL